MQMITISDKTLIHASSQAEQTLGFREKLEIAKLLDKVKVDVLETPPIGANKVDLLLVKSIASSVKHAIICVPVPLSEDGIAQCFEAVKNAAHKRLQVVIPTSPVQIEYICHKKPPLVLSMITILISACKALCEDVEFVADDATRAIPEFLHQAVEAAISAGATTITLSDDEGSMLPDEFATFITSIKKAVPSIANVKIGVQCSNELHMAVACANAAMGVGATEIKVTSVGECIPDLEAFSHLLRIRGMSCGLSQNLVVTQLQRTVKQIKWIGSTRRSKTTPFDNGVQSPDSPSVFLNSFDDATSVGSAVKKLGYDLNEDDSAKVFEEFVRIAMKKNVGAKELDAIVASVALQVPPTYRLISYVINCGNIIGATAHIELEKDDEILSGLSLGDGSIDAAFLALEQIVGHHYELDDFQISAVTEGREAMGSALIKIRSEGTLYSGKGISTDIIGASIRAYVNALNKIVYEEN